MFGQAMMALAVAAAGGAQAAADPLEATLVQMEKDSWVAWQGHDGKFFQGFLSDDHVEVGVGGPSGKKGVVDGVASGVCVVAAYKLDRFAFHRLGPDTAVLTYWADQTTRCGAAAVPSPVWATSVYQRRGGRWVNVVYVHTPAAKAGG